MPSEEFRRELVVGADPTRCWATLTDVPRLVEWISLLSDAEEQDPLRRYRAVLTDRLGPFSLRAELAIDVDELVMDRSLHLRAEGEDRHVASRIVVDGRLELVPAETGTRIRVDGRYEVTGRVASLGSAMIRKNANRIVEEFFDNAARDLD